jgi:hypothetical protein
LSGRHKKGQFGLLPLSAPLRALRQEGIPSGVLRQFVFQEGGHPMADIIGIDCLGVALEKTSNAIAHIRPVVGNELDRHSGALCHPLQDLRHPLAGDPMLLIRVTSILGTLISFTTWC